MAVRISDEFVKEQRPWVKRAMKGRPLFFGLQAQAAKKGKFLLSKKPGLVKPAKVKDLQVYQGDGKDATKAEAKNTIPGGAAMGVAQGGNGTLTLYFEKGKGLPVAEKFVKFFVTKEMKFKLVKKVKIAEVDTLPNVPEDDESDHQQATPDSVLARVKQLAETSKAVGGDACGVPNRLKDAAVLAKSNPTKADDDLDEIEFLIGTLQRAKELQEQLQATLAEPGVDEAVAAPIGKRINQALSLVESGDVDKADDELDVAEQSLANLRQAAGLPAIGAQTPDAPPDAPPDDDTAASFFTDWLNGIKPDLKTLKEAQAPEMKQIGEHVVAVSAALGKKDWPTATDEYKRADALITAALKKARSAQAVAEARVSAEAFQREWSQANAKLQAAVDKSEGQLTQLATALADSEDANMILVAEEGISRLIRDFREIANSLGKAAVRQPAKTVLAARPLVGRLKQQLDGEQVRVCDENQFGVGVSVKQTVGRALTDVEKTFDLVGT